MSTQSLRHAAQPDTKTTEHGYEPKTVLFFNRSTRSVFWLSLVTLNIYNLYWVFRHYSVINQSSGSTYRALLRTIFQIFTIHHLFTLIVDTEKASRKASATITSTVNVGTLTALYVLFMLIGSGLSRLEGRTLQEEVLVWGGMFIASFIVAWATSRIQSIAILHNLNVNPSSQALKESFVGRVRPGEVILSVVFVLLFTVAFLSIMYSFSDSSIQTSPNLETAKGKYDSLTKQYEVCSNELNTKYDMMDGNNPSTVEEYEADYDACEAIRLEQNAAADEYDRAAGIEE